MNELPRDDSFGTALRAVLVAQVEGSVPATRRKHRHLWLGAGIFAGAGLLGGIGAAAAGILTLPGADTVTALAASVSATHSGAATVELGPAPPGATNVALDLTCLTPGHFEFDDGASVDCSATDIGTRQAWGGYSLRLAPGQHTVSVQAGPAERWQLTARYVNQTTTEWAVNSHGKSYGVENANGAPDLVAAVATNGIDGYVLKTDLNDADGTTAAKNFKSPQDAVAWQNARRGKTFKVPVYESDGTTVVGEFVIGGG